MNNLLICILLFLNIFYNNKRSVYFLYVCLFIEFKVSNFINFNYFHFPRSDNKIKRSIAFRHPIRIVSEIGKHSLNTTASGFDSHLGDHRSAFNCYMRDTM